MAFVKKVFFQPFIGQRVHAPGILLSSPVNKCSVRRLLVDQRSVDVVVVVVVVLDGEDDGVVVVDGCGNDICSGGCCCRCGWRTGLKQRWDLRG